ncbi:MAG: hypothetical protein ABII88_07595 [Candidatus Omnitrophota bacterium]
MKSFCLLIIFLLAPVTVYAGGLSSNWGEVIVNNLEPGNTYDLNEIAGSTFKITNNFDKEITIKLEVLRPIEEELKPGYEPIENTSWVQIEEEAKINAGEYKVIPIKISIPDDSKYLGKKYHFWVWTYTSGQAVGVGLKSRILISIID